MLKPLAVAEGRTILCGFLEQDIFSKVYRKKPYNVS